MGITGLLERARLSGDQDDEPNDLFDPFADDDDVSDVTSRDRDTVAFQEDDLLEPDPAPQRDPETSTTKIRNVGKKINSTIGSGERVRVTVKQKNEIRDALEMIQLMLGGGIQFRDPHCGGAIVDNASNVADKMVPIICRNPKWVAWFTGGAGWLDVVGLIIALKPVASTAWGHHVSKTVGVGGGDQHQHADFSQFAAPTL